MKALQEFGLSQREACKSIHARRRSASQPATTKAERDASVAARSTQVAQVHADHGCCRLYYEYERVAFDGDQYMNYKALRRIYRLAGLQMGRRRRRGRAKIVRGRSLRRATKPFEGWTLDFIQDRLFNSFNFSVRAEFLNVHWVRSLIEARAAAVEWRHAYHTTHAHSALNYTTPQGFLATYEANQSSQKSLAA